MLKTLKASITIINKPFYNPAQQREMTYIHSIRLKSKDAIKSYANDGTGKHPHVLKQTCVNENCENKQCANPCAEPINQEVYAHLTHAPKVGRYTRYVSNTDANGELKAQYYIKATGKEISAKEFQKLLNSKAIKEDQVVTIYINSTIEITNKYHE